MLIRIGQLDRTPDEVEKIIRADWDDRRAKPRQTDNLAYGAGVAFQGLKAQLHEHADQYIGGIYKKIDQRIIVTPTEIDNVRTLEKLKLAVQYDPAARHFQRFAAYVDSGGRSGEVEWKKLETRAKHQGLLAGHNDPVRVAHTHGKEERSYRLH